jgi:hypothetical protein
LLFDTASPLAPSSSVIPTSVGVAIVSAYMLDWAKRLKQVPKISYYSTRLNTWLRVLMAGIGTLGVSWAWSPVSTTGRHELMIMFPSNAALLAGLYHWTIQFCMQHFGEIQLAQRPTAQKAMVEQAKDEPKDLPGKTPVGPVTTTAVGQAPNKEITR